MKEELIETMMTLTEAMGDPRFTKALAKTLWQVFTDLQEQGFTKDQAMQLTISFAKPSK